MNNVENRNGELRRVAEALAGDAAAFVRDRRAEVFAAAAEPAVRTKSTPTDPVTVVDTETERFLRDRLARLRPGEAVLGEEGGGDTAAPGAVTWVVDPIDGTVNFVYGIPAYAVSIAAQIDGVSVAGAVADVAGAAVYSAAAGQGARLTDAHGTRPLRCTAVGELSLALVGTGFGYSATRRAAQAALLAELLPKVRDVRRIGSAALDLCLVAAGRLDAFYEHGLNVWDWAAGTLIAAEAGATVRLASPPSAGPVLAAAPGIAAEIEATLAGFGGLAPIGE
ncbi:inositol monophosphatase family protein [Mycobacterium sp. 1274756.6]|uniref:inositol monophosphatase family protein n=1 Tax=Mycobacterium sp. 1274756.6 TaxID=1834076 RepID=UPI0007FFF6DC|nr:inositol monophosphatase family protein [Mycobacterium sp. 1274756.6]OBJ71375.1 inositol monophosphatase [Mycobacterium sp. 1274756.6]